ncbi:MAG: preprotein translocase subunit SecG [Patescibacteria group bacterium]|jgi:preprotein translocase subunit SecG|nr:preprotein translocase subunit SecG [Patescibacteria group bacterium]MDD3777788.1 preprotein translocase subunit SecG [Patescibacteria group bacterium]MDD3939602.1 preprotein translocase subunit SecG [Patescibacteria group bacterium]MDD4443535.1 preprotein translocase subunit SecG [Patescibacteria group bacterium]NCU39479.1 preprotein translocase subunit SecG [Candidatus Falkowbacteria bacterium]
MDFWLKIGQVIIAIMLMIVILMQNRGSGVGGVFGGGGGGVYLTKRGFEKKLFNFTIILAVVFVVISLASFWINT